MTKSADPSGTSETTLASLASLENRAWTTKLLVAATLGLVVGAILGGIVFRMLGTDITAAAIVRITQPVDLIALAGGASQTTPNTQENLQSYATGEVAFLNGQGFAQAVGQKLGKSSPAFLNIMQNGETTVVTISSTAASDSDALRTVAAALDLYRAELARRSDQQLRSILPALDQWEAGASPDRVADIEGIRNRVNVQSTPTGMFAVLQSPTLDDAVGQRGLMGELLGGLLGAALLPLILMARRRRIGRLTSDPEIAEAIDGLLFPAVDLRQPPVRSWGDDQATLARTLWAQLPSTRSTRTIVVLGTSSSSGSAVVSSLLAYAAAEQGSARQMTLTDDDGASLPVAGDGETVIVDAGAMGQSPLVPEAIAAATDLLLVARMGVDSVPHAMAVKAATASSPAPLVAVFTHKPWWSLRRANRETTEPAQSAEESDA